MNPKIKSPQTLAKLLQRKKHKHVVFTNGCFDILHAGHVRYLTQARALGNMLVVALNTDASVQRLKGKSRPIVPLEEQAEVIAALECVDYVTFFSEDTPYELISLLRPNILVKGGDWKTDSIVGADIVKKNGGKVKVLRFHPGKSTTHIIEKIRCLASE